MVRAGRQAWAPFSLGTPRRSQPCPSLALRLSLPDWERMDACCLKLPHWWSCSQQPWEMHKAAMAEMKKLRPREVKSSARDTQQAGTEVRAVWQPSSFPGQRLVGLANLSHGYLYPGSTPWVYLSPKTTTKVLVSECIFKADTWGWQETPCHPSQEQTPTTLVSEVTRP